MSILHVCEWLQNTYTGTMVRESLWGFPIFVTLHILGLTLSAGSVLWFDLRLLGVTFGNIRISRLYRRLMPVVLGGFAVMFATGAILFSGFATTAYGNTYFRLKMLAIVVAGLNALVYHAVTERRIALWDDAVRPPAMARLAGLISILTWMSAIFAGRMMSYTMF